MGGRGGPVGYPGVNESALVGEDAGLYRLLGVAFFGGATSPPTRSPVYGSQEVRTYSDSADGKVVGFFGNLDKTSVAQLGVDVVSPANGLVVSAITSCSHVLPFPFKV